MGEMGVSEPALARGSGGIPGGPWGAGEGGRELCITLRVRSIQVKRTNGRWETVEKISV